MEVKITEHLKVVASPRENGHEVLLGFFFGGKYVAGGKMDKHSFEKEFGVEIQFVKVK